MVDAKTISYEYSHVFELKPLITFVALSTIYDGFSLLAETNLPET